MNEGRRENEMPKVLKREAQSMVSPASQMSFAVALCAFIAAGIGLVVNHWVTGWMAVGGMCGVGLFYIVVGLLNLRSNPPLFEDDSKSTVSQRTARAENLVGEPITRPRNSLSVYPKSTQSQQPKK
jgi:hypothetical protein